MKRFLLCMLAVCCVLVAASGCDTRRQQDEFADDAFSPPSGFTRTDEDGQVLSEDPDDWRISPAFLGRVLVEPAFPNPTGDQFVNVRVRVLEFNAVAGGLQLVGLDDTNNFFRLDQVSGELGADVLTFNPSFLGRRGLVRVFILDGRNEIVSYGDLQVE